MEFIKIDKALRPYIALLTLNRPKEHNALNSQLVSELAATLQELDSDEVVRAIVITGNT